VGRCFVVWKNVRRFASMSLARLSRIPIKKEEEDSIHISPPFAPSPWPLLPRRRPGPRPSLHPRVLSALPPSRLRIPFALGLAADLAAPFCAASPRAICLAVPYSPGHWCTLHRSSTADQRGVCGSVPTTLAWAASSRKWEVGPPTPKVQS
jgi:hypothetical protein